MGYLAVPYKTTARFFADSDQEHELHWFFAAEDADLFPHPHSFGPAVYMDSRVEPADWKYPGEKEGPRENYPGASPFGASGKDGCLVGKPEWFLSGAPIGQTRLTAGVPECCRRVFPTSQWAPFILLGPFGNSALHRPVLSFADDYSTHLFVWGPGIGNPPAIATGYELVHEISLGVGERFFRMTRRVPPGPNPEFITVTTDQRPLGVACGLEWVNSGMLEVENLDVRLIAPGMPRTHPGIDVPGPNRTLCFFLASRFIGPNLPAPGVWVAIAGGVTHPEEAGLWRTESEAPPGPSGAATFLGTDDDEPSVIAMFCVASKEPTLEV